MKIYLIKEKVGYEFNQEGKQVENWVWFRKFDSRMICVYCELRSAKAVATRIKNAGHRVKICEFETDWGIELDEQDLQNKNG